MPPAASDTAGPYRESPIVGCGEERGAQVGWAGASHARLGGGASSGGGGTSCCRVTAVKPANAIRDQWQHLAISRWRVESLRTWHLALNMAAALPRSVGSSPRLWFDRSRGHSTHLAPPQSDPQLWRRRKRTLRCTGPHRVCAVLKYKIALSESVRGFLISSRRSLISAPRHTPSWLHAC